MHENFRYHKIFRNLEGIPTKLFGTVSQKKSTDKRDTPYYA